MWKFNLDSLKEDYDVFEFEVPIEDSLGNLYNKLSAGRYYSNGKFYFTLSCYLVGYPEATRQQIIFRTGDSKGGLAFNEDGTLKEDYYLKFKSNTVDFIIGDASYGAVKYLIDSSHLLKYNERLNLIEEQMSQKANQSEIPTKTSQLENDKNFIENEGFADNLEIDFLKVNEITSDPIFSFMNDDGVFENHRISEKANTNYVNQKISELLNNIATLSMQIVDVLPTQNISSNTIYLLSKTNAGEADVYNEYVYINNSWELIGSTKVNLSDYAKLTDVPTKISELNQDIDYALKEELPTKLLQLENEILIKNAPNLKGTWYLRESNMSKEIFDKLGHLNENINFTDSLGNKFINIECSSISGPANKYIPELQGTLEDGTVLIIYDTKDSLYNSVENYYLTFETEAVSSYVLMILNSIGDKVDKVISNEEAKILFNKVNEKIGDINSILDQLNGEVV